MNFIHETRVKTAYYFASSDQEILDDRLLALSCDEETWLYKVGDSSFNARYGHFQLDSAFEDQFKHPPSGYVDGRTFTRRKLRPSLDSVIESPLSNNRSSLGLLSNSKLLNDSLVSHHLPNQENQDKISSNSTVSEQTISKQLAPRVFKLDSPLINTAPLEIKSRIYLRNVSVERKRLDSESSDYSLPHSLDQINSFDHNCVMTASLTNFLEKDDVRFPPPTAFEDDVGMTNSIISLSGNHEDLNLDVTGKSFQMTDSLVGFLEHVNCKPPSGFEDGEIPKPQEPDLSLSYRMKSVVNQVEKTESNILTPLQFPNENIPPESKITGKLLVENNSNDRSNLLQRVERQLNWTNYNTYKIGTHKDNNFIKNGDREPNNSSISISQNILTRIVKQSEEVEEEKTKPLSTNTETFGAVTKESIEKNNKAKALNNRDLNVKRDIYSDEENELNTTKTLSNQSVPLNNNKMNTTINRNNTFSKNDSHETSVRQIPLRNSTFNTTFTKLESPGSKGLNSTFVKSMDGLNGGLEDDQTSSASDSSFSSCSTKPRSVDELRSIAQQQEISLAQQTSTPTEELNIRQSSNLAKLNIELSPIRRLSTGGSRTIESRSANCSPVRRPNHQSPHPHPINRFQPPTVEVRRQMLQASSLSNIARPKSSGLRLPQPVSRYSRAPETTFTRPSTAPTAAAFTGIPRPQASRLPQPRFRGTGIPGPKRGGVN